MDKERFFEVAEVIYDRGERESLAALCTQVLDIDETGCALFWLAVLRLERGLKRAATFCFAQSLPLLLQHKKDKIVKANLGWMYNTGGEVAGVKKDVEKAITLYKEAAEEGLARAQTNLGRLYFEGRGVPEDQNEALRLLNLAAESGYLGALSTLASIYFFRTSEFKKEGLNLFYRCAEEGHPKSLYELGWIFMSGQGGITPDKEKAMAFFSLSVEKGNAEAANNLGWMYEMGEVLPANIPKAIHYYELAIEEGSSSAEYNLGFLYERGGCEGKGVKDAVELYRSSAQKGNLSAHHTLGRLYFWGLGVAKNKKEAVRLWMAVANLPGLPTLQYDLGNIYSIGDPEGGIEKNIEEAVRLLCFASGQGHEPAKQSLVSIFESYLEGEGQTT